ncbi:helix-turn-helix domain-containing protein [Cognatiyoonia sp. IB215182]|uniref:winged helix-turn-helix transcriptional regulator n=1 Tax=Cognatiyoonia sp. IB215182 TaxID=3097353 RepID=UPI002A0B41FD|nr:helix-turn-helix domain-containing protein [Cognatiyoonia sp. IB215182]MDX8355111.1 helix-turn-helix domain-containing protein [Cognatiyoonia sp. IB215182]
MRFNDLSRMIGGASKKMVTERLRRLEEQGLVRRDIAETKPLSVVYEVTDLGDRCLASSMSFARGVKASPMKKITLSAKDLR